MYKVTREFKFEAAHRLHKLPSNHPCSNLHGHSYVVKVTLECDTLNDVGFIIDFGELKNFQKWLDENMDHAVILCQDDLMTGYITNGPAKTKMYIMEDVSSAENMAKLFAEMISSNVKCENPLSSIEVKVWETVKNCATYTLNL